MRVVVVGATGNVGSSLVRLLASDDKVSSVLGIARRRPALELPKTDWAEADLLTDDLVSLFRGADAVVHLAWLIQPSHDLPLLERVNVEGSSRLFDAAAEAGVHVLVYASSVGAYSRGSKDRLVDESWPVEGIRSSFYARHKAEVERRLDVFEHAHADVRVVRLRPALIFKREAASGVRRLFAGPLVPSPLLRSALIPLLADVPGLRFQAVHTEDVAEAYRLALVREVRGAFNIAAEPILDPPLVAQLVGARLVRVPSAVARWAVSVSWRLHLQPTPPGWFDLGLSVPLLDTTRARTELGWSPRRRADEALLELVDGMRERAGDDTPPLSPGTGGPARLREVLTGVGRRGGIAH
jgi:UDP-glucose 4-epimerase